MDNDLQFSADTRCYIVTAPPSFAGGSACDSRHVRLDDFFIVPDGSGPDEDGDLTGYALRNGMRTHEDYIWVAEQALTLESAVSARATMSTGPAQAAATTISVEAVSRAASALGAGRPEADQLIRVARAIEAGA